MILENWSIIYGGDPYLAPELRTSQLQGEVYKHPKFENGKRVTTSTIIEAKNGKVKTFSGSIYKLGEPHPDYEKAFPNAKERLFK